VQGPTGPAGATGAQGANGPTGATGVVQINNAGSPVNVSNWGIRFDTTGPSAATGVTGYLWAEY